MLEVHAVGVRRKRPKSKMPMNRIVPRNYRVGILRPSRKIAPIGFAQVLGTTARLL